MSERNNDVLDPAPDLGDVVVGWLAGGRRPRLSEVTDELVTEGYVDDAFLAELALGEPGEPGAELDREELEGFVLDELQYEDLVWSTGHEDPWLAPVDALVSELVLTHRLTAHELERQEVPLVPDLVALDYHARAGLNLAGGGTVRAVRGPGPRRPGHDDDVIRGPEGWLEGFSPSDLVVFRRRGEGVTVEPAGELAPDDHVVLQLQDAAAHRVPAGQGEEAFPMVFDAMTMDPDAFRRAARPLGELLQAAGLERRGFMWGPQGKEWADAAQRARPLRRGLTARRYGFNRCCLAAYDRVIEAVSTPGGQADSGRLATDLAHGWVAPAAATEALDFPDDGDDGDTASGSPTGAAEHGSSDRAARLERLAADMAAGPGANRAAGLLVLALAAGQRGQALAAETHLRQALRDDPGYQPALQELVRFEIDRGDLDAAVDLMNQVGAPFAAHVEDRVRRAHDRLTTPYRKAGRNQPCPCGSGRKYKTCCLRSPRLSPRERGVLLDLKLAVFAHAGRGDRVFAVANAAAAAENARDRLSNPVVTDILAFEGGLAEHYLAQRGELLPDEERAVLRAAIDERRRLWEVVETGPGPYISLRDTDTDRTSRVYDPVAATPTSVGVTLLWRIVRLGTTDYPLGFHVEVEPNERDSLRKLLADSPTAHDLATWYREAG